MPELPKIPVPWSQRWRSIRFRMLPALVFALAVTGTVFLWNRQLVVTQAVGEVYGRRIDVAVQYDGVLLDTPYRNWRLFDRVEAGAILARLDDAPTLAMIDTIRQELKQAEAELESARQEFELSEDDRKFDRATEARRLAVDVETLRLAIADRKSQLAADEMEYRRQQERMDVVDRLKARSSQDSRLPPLMSQLDTLEIQRLRDVAQERIAGHKQYIAEAEGTLEPAQERLQQQAAAAQGEIDAVLNPLRATMAYQEARIRELELVLRSLDIRAPMSGYIVPPTAANAVAAAQPVPAMPGQHVRAGTVLFTVASDEPEYIVSYVRPTQRLRPEVGMTVAVRPRNTNQLAHTFIERVGPQVEMVPGHQARDQKLMEWGLPVRLPVPGALRHLGLRPGELVDLKFLPPEKSAPAADDVAQNQG